MRFAFAILRASILEEIIIKEVYGEEAFRTLQNQPLLKLIEKARYRDAVALILKESLPYQHLHLSIENAMLYGSGYLPASYFEPYFIKEADIEKNLHLLETLDLQFHNNRVAGSPFNARQWLSLATVGSESAFYTRGPRPRLGGGWGKDIQSSAGEERIQALKPFDKMMKLDGPQIPTTVPPFENFKNNNFEKKLLQQYPKPELKYEFNNPIKK